MPEELQAICEGSAVHPQWVCHKAVKAATSVWADAAEVTIAIVAGGQDCSQEGVARESLGSADFCCDLQAKITCSSRTICSQHSSFLQFTCLMDMVAPVAIALPMQKLHRIYSCRFNFLRRFSFLHAVCSCFRSHAGNIRHTCSLQSAACAAE